VGLANDTSTYLLVDIIAEAAEDFICNSPTDAIGGNARI
jgi:hypothetical protein